MILSFDVLDHFLFLFVVCEISFIKCNQQPFSSGLFCKAQYFCISTPIFSLQARNPNIYELNDFCTKAIEIFKATLWSTKEVLWGHAWWWKQGMKYIYTVLERALLVLVLSEWMVSFQKYLADIISVLALTMSEEGERVGLHILLFSTCYAASAFRKC